MKKMILIDGNSLLFRAYYATAYSGNLMKSNAGIHTNAIFAFKNLLDKVYENSYDYTLVAFDTGAPTFRHKEFSDYKAGRGPVPVELIEQFPIAREYLDAAGISRLELDGYEADDIIGTLAKQASKENISVEIFSSDRDLLQLVDDNITVNLLKQGMRDVSRYTPATLFAEFNLSHEQMIDFKALTGDPSDNIPGIPGIGPKTATKLLVEYQSIAGIYANVKDLKGKMAENIINSGEQVKLWQMLVEIDTNVPLDVKVSSFSVDNSKTASELEFYQKYDLDFFAKKISQNVKKEPIKHQKISSEEQLQEILKPDLAIYLELDDYNYHRAFFWGLGLSDGKSNWIIAQALLESNLLIDYLEDEAIIKSTFDYKKHRVFLRRYGIKPKGFTFDLLMGTYLIDSNLPKKEEFKAITNFYNHHAVEYDENIYGKGVKKSLPDDAAVYEKHIASKAQAIYLLKSECLEKLTERSQLDLLTELEIPLSGVLADMEVTGFRVDQAELEQQKITIFNDLSELEKKIHEVAGEEFNVASPKQLGDILFEKLDLPVVKKTKTGYSTDIDVLNELSSLHEIIPLVMKHRQLAKIYGTYLEGMSQHIFSDGKVHTIFEQALTTTGRLSSIEPNLQNIPVRTEEGRNIRKMFIASKENSYLVAADYSQIELRVLADIANVSSLISAFENDIDVHSQTARDVFKISEVSTSHRRMAKAVNFGIIYGIGAWGLSQDLGISPREAQKFIDTYLDVYPEIKTYMEDMKVFVKENGYVKTLLNRRRYIPEINSKVHSQRGFGERTALNAPIQGTAADIIKVAMINLHKYISDNNLESRILLQVHDELVLEVPADELNLMKQMLPQIMEEAFSLKVEIKADVSIGKTWFEL